MCDFAKAYVGWTSQGLEKRKRRHISVARSGSYCYFHKAIRKYGTANFVWEILWEGQSEKQTKSIEIQMIRDHKTRAPIGYNMTAGGDGIANPCARIRQKISKALKGKTPSKETLKLMSEVQKGKKHSKTTRQKMSEAHKGCKHTDETRQKISKARQGMKLTVEHCKNISESHKGKKHSKETRQKISQSLIGNNRAVKIAQRN